MEIRNTAGELLDHTFSPNQDAGRDLVVLGHGVTANKDRPFLVRLAEALTAVGIASLRISFSGNGNSGGRFVDSTVSKEVEDLGAVLDAVAASRRITYVGHSMGGAVGVLRAAVDPRIECLVSLAGMVHTRDFVERKFGDLTPDRDLMWDKPECPLSSAYVADMTTIDTVTPQAELIDVPWLLVHGTADEVVLPRDSHDVKAAAGGRPDLVELPGVDHVFSGEGAAIMTAAVVPWLQTQLG